MDDSKNRMPSASTKSLFSAATHCRMGMPDRHRYVLDVTNSPKLFRISATMLAISLSSPDLRAHHSPGHGPSETLRTLGALGGNPAPRQRAALIGQVARSSAEPTLNTATTYGFSALANFRFARRLFVGAEVPFVIVDQDATHKLEAGLGDSRLSAQVQLSNMKAAEAASFLVGLAVTIPTRTISYQSDPGRQWVVTPGFRYADAHRRVLWYALLLAPLETRPAGTAWDLSPAVGLGVRIFEPWTLSAGVSADIRVANWCKTTDGTEFCRDGRATESSRPTGATRVYALLATTVDVAKNWSILGSGQAPLSKRRDIEWLFNLGVEVRF